MASLREVLITIQDKLNQVLDWEDLTSRYPYVEKDRNIMLEIWEDKASSLLGNTSSRYYLVLDLESQRLEVTSKAPAKGSIVRAWMSEQIAWGLIVGNISPMGAWLTYPDQCGLEVRESKEYFHAESLDHLWRTIRQLALSALR